MYNILDSGCMIVIHWTHLTTNHQSFSPFTFQFCLVKSYLKENVLL